MRLWSLHPKYLDRKGLLSLWREALLAQKVLTCKTKGYQKHPQLKRFQEHSNPIKAIGFYLFHVYKEGKKRGYRFNGNKIKRLVKKIRPIKVTQGQIDFEVSHLRKKLKLRDKKGVISFANNKCFTLHPLFMLVEGDIEDWERGRGRP